MSAVTLGEAFRTARTRIHSTDAGVLLCHVIGRDPAYLIAHPDMRLRADEHESFASLVERRAQGEPVAYLTGEREFYGRAFKISPAVLIPRPETELLVDLALERIQRSPSARVLDMGTGSGCVAVAIASERSHAKVLALDQSLEALAVARRNAVRLGAGNVAFLQSDWFDGLGPERFDLIVSNPPYVASGDPHLQEGDVRFEPRNALEAGGDGLNAIRRIVSGAERYLVPAGWLLFEHGYDQAMSARKLLQAAGYQDVFSARDLAGIERVSGGRLTMAASDR
ncbi:MAG: release factor glutamine methyltransferase [Betaproteobacteria bacterium]|jgi:release factor glutamine methyltransferase|nr:release factor glutamine methyltransferase [Betaproteobacteria bacterium]